MATADHQLGRLASLWHEGRARRVRPALQRDLKVDVAVLGAGITGLSAAQLLQERGARVAVLEARHVGAGTSGYTTAKLSSLHGLTYARLMRVLGEERTRIYGQANEAGIARVFRLSSELGIDCDLRRRPNLTYTPSAGERDQIEAEVEAAQKVGLPASLVEESDLPFPIAAAVRFDQQAEFHPLKFIAGLADALGEALHERTRAVSVEAGSPCRVHTEQGRTVSADKVVVATHMPVLDRGLFFARASPERSYCAAARVRASEAPSGMYLSTEQPAHSIRVHQGDGERWLIVGGESHKTGHGDALERYVALGDWMRTRFGLSPELRWSSHDIMPADGVPFVGRLNPVSENLFVATGFRKWGLAMGCAASLLLAELIDGRDHPWRELFDPNRLRLRSSAEAILKENADTGMRFFGDRLLKRQGVDDIPRGEGRVVGRGIAQRAVYRDADGALHALSARCTHLGCVVNWNRGEGTWDCPCHGSRYDRHGAVIEGPAVRPLEPEPLD